MFTAIINASIDINTKVCEVNADKIFYKKIIANWKKIYSGWCRERMTREMNINKETVGWGKIPI